jgi:hypothetical protein
VRADVLWGLLLFVALQLGLAVAIEYGLPRIRDPFYAYRAERLRRQTVDAPRPHLTVVMLGSSRVRDGLQSGDLGRQFGAELGRDMLLFNFGIPQCGPVVSLLYFERLHAAGLKPDLLLIDVAPMLLAPRSAEGKPRAPLESRYRQVNRLWHRELDVAERYGFPTDEYQRVWWQTTLAPCYGLRFEILNSLVPKLLGGPINRHLSQAWNIDELGNRPRFTAEITAEMRRSSVAATRGEFADVLAHFQLCQTACQAQRRLLARCREEQIPSVLVLMPEGEEFRSWYAPEAMEQIKTHLHSLSREFTVPIIDARCWVADEGFADGHHMLPNGASVFTQRLGRELLEPVLALDSAQRAEYLVSRARRDLESIVADDAQQERLASRQAANDAGRYNPQIPQESPPLRR